MARDPNSEEFQDEEQDRSERAGFALQLAVLAVICRRLAKVTRDTTYAKAREWQTRDMGTISKLLASGATSIGNLIDSVMSEVAEDSDDWAAPFYAAKGVRQRKVSEDVFLSEALSSGERAAKESVERICRTSAVGIVAPDGTLKRLDEGYKDVIDSAIRAIQQGQSTYEDAVLKAVRNLSDYGLRVRYESGATRELYSAVAMNVQDGYRSTTQKVRDQQAKQFGADGVEVSAHSVCAEDHLPYQGRQFSNEEFAEIQRKLKRPIAQGKNCRHTVTGIVMGASSRAYSTKELQQMRKDSRRKTGVKRADGHDMTAYEFTQWQRQQETQVRKLKAKAALMERSGLSGAEWREQAQLVENRYYAMSRKAKLRTRPERLEVYEWKL